MNSKKIKKYVTHNVDDSIHTGQLLKSYFKSRRIHKSALARNLNRNIGTLLNYQKNSTIQVAILWEISQVLKHNFFDDIACKLPPEFSSDAPVQTLQSERIVELEEELRIVKAERDVLKSVLGGGK